MKLRVVLDTNIYISAFLFKGLPGKVLDLAISEQIEVFTSSYLLQEIEGVLSRKFKIKQFEIDTIIGEIKDFANLTNPSVKLKVIKNDSPDNRVLECAVASKAGFIVSGDKRHLLSLGKFKNILIISAKDFVDSYYGKRK